MLVQEATISTAAGAVLGRSFAEIVTADHIIASAQAIESLNNHPVAQSITRYALAQGASKSGIPNSARPTYAVSDFSVTPGSGAAGRVSILSQSPVVLIGSPAAVAHSSTEFHQRLNLRSSADKLRA
jgi:Cu+-exporting ATPase